MGCKNKGFDKEVERTKKLEDAFYKHAEECLVDMVMILYRQSVKLTPVDTGNLRRSWQMLLIKRSRTNFSGGVCNLCEYAPHVNYGHRIKNNGKYCGYVEGQYFQEHARELVKSSFDERKRQLLNDIKREVGR